MIKILGFILALDGLLSMIFVKDKRPLWQLGATGENDDWIISYI